jgi:hypothetical protein
MKGQSPLKMQALVSRTSVMRTAVIVLIILVWVCVLYCWGGSVCSSRFAKVQAGMTCDEVEKIIDPWNGQCYSNDGQTTSSEAYQRTGYRWSENDWFPKFYGSFEFSNGRLVSKKLSTPTVSEVWSHWRVKLRLH